MIADLKALDVSYWAIYKGSQRRVAARGFVSTREIRTRKPRISTRITLGMMKYASVFRFVVK